MNFNEPPRNLAKSWNLVPPSRPRTDIQSLNRPYREKKFRTRSKYRGPFEREDREDGSFVWILNGRRIDRIFHPVKKVSLLDLDINIPLRRIHNESSKLLTVFVFVFATRECFWRKFENDREYLIMINYVRSTLKIDCKIKNTDTWARSSNRFLSELDNRVCWFNRTEDVYRKDEESGREREERKAYKGRGSMQIALGTFRWLLVSAKPAAGEEGKRSSNRSNDFLKIFLPFHSSMRNIYFSRANPFDILLLSFFCPRETSYRLTKTLE